MLRATKVWDDDPVANSRRARYTAGVHRGPRAPRLRRRAGCRSCARHRDARRGDLRDRDCAVGRSALHDPVGQGPRGEVQRDRSAIQAGVAHPARLGRIDPAVGAAPFARPRSHGARDQRERTGRTFPPRTCDARDRVRRRSPAARTPRCSKASSTPTRRSRCAGTRPSGAGRSSSRSSTPGSATRSPSTSTRRDRRAPSTGHRCERAAARPTGSVRAQ